MLSNRRTCAMAIWCALAAIVSSMPLIAAAQTLPKIDIQPGKWSYSTRTEIQGMGSIPSSFEQCVTQKDIDQGAHLQAQKSAGLECVYANVKSSGNRHTFTSTCKSSSLPEPLVTDYDMTSSPTAMEMKMKMSGGIDRRYGGNNMTMTMQMKRVGGC
jgi:hypothetical protein